MKIKDVRLTADDVRTLIRAREQVKAVKQAWKKYRLASAEILTVKSPKLDGVPGKNCSVNGIEKGFLHLESFQSRFEGEEQKLGWIRESASKVMDSLPFELYAFCLWYYIEGMSMQETAAGIDRSETSCWRYKQIIERPLQDDAAVERPEI